MNFIKTQKMLTQQAEQKEIPLESVLELMRTYLAELRYHTGTSVDKCHIGNMSQVIASLAAVSNDILFVYRTNEKEIQAAESRFTQSLSKSQTACGEYHSRITQLDEQIRQSKADLARLEALQQEESNRNAALAQLRQQTAVLQAQVDALSATNGETEAGRLKNLLETQTRELERLTAEFDAMEQTRVQQLAQLEEENARLAELRTQVDADFAKLKETGQIIQDQQDIRKELAQQIQKLEHEAWLLKESNDKAHNASFDLIAKNDQAKEMLEQQTIENNMWQASMEERIAEKKALEAQLELNKSFARTLEQQHAAIEEENTTLREQVAALEQAICNIREEGGQLLDQLNALKGMQEKIRADYGDACQLHQERNLELQELEEKLALQNQENAAIQETVEGKNAQFTQLSTLHQEKSAQLQALNSEMEKLEKDLQRMQEDASRRRAEIVATEEALTVERQEFDQLLEQQVALNVDLEAQKTDNQNFRDCHLEPIKAQLADLVIQARNDRSQLEELKNSISLLEDNRTTMASQNAMLLMQLKSQQANLDKVTAAYQQNKQAVAVLEEDLRIKGTESAALLEKEKELRELLDEKNVSRITAELENCNKKLEEDIRRAEQTEKDLAHKQHQILTLQEQLSVVQAELEECRRKEKELLENHESVAKEMDRITCWENRKHCEKLHNQLQLMLALRDQLLARIPATCGQGFAVPERLQQHLKESEQAIETLRQVIRDYTAQRQSILENCN